MGNWRLRLRQIPVVVVLCLLLLGLWGVSQPDPSAVVCDRAAPGQAYCRATLPPPWAWLPSQSFLLDDVAMTSELCDNNPHGGVRFCHRLTLLGAEHQITLPEVRTPLSAAALREQLRQFVAGEGSPHLSWSSPGSGVPWRTLVIALLLVAANWALWDVRWPPAAPSPLALDGAVPARRAIDAKD
ncbi:MULTISPECIES: hypothetical protein [Cyanophyceae]|uniref:hypothetical protein n=1 Tax=Cyanophyceae TaxID=3028117 RepID=UPI0016859CA2|nr:MULTISPECIES: hypothetical protein [Cyanophyceae]MBD1914762.1 hypothetical protein [Phormidium sp. FACHB-77]MBD2030865.1 hypothetical protein [Phormidium sp. FACHB-322]MBD2052464.1 hypothetical protein [Leptolyngbya sp. FACHB-60]